jgi:glutathione S-transferase
MKERGEVMALKLYYGPGSCSLAPLAALEEAGAKYDPIRVTLANGEQRSKDFLALNARGQVPVLVADGQIITENLAVLTYIAHQYPEAQLLPVGDPAKLASAYELLSWFATNAHVAIAQIFRGERFSADPVVQENLKAFGLTRFKAALAEFDRASSETWLLGSRFSVVDPLALITWRWGERLQLDLSPYPALEGLVGRVRDRPSVARALALEAA